MIKLDVEDYCQNCQDFYPEKETTKLYDGFKMVDSQTIVYCHYRNRCAAVAKWLAEHPEDRKED